MQDKQSEFYVFLLEERIEELEKKLDQLNDLVYNLMKPSYDLNKLPSTLPTTQWNMQCSRCGIALDKVMCYNCPSIDCPTGLGPLLCES